MSRFSKKLRAHFITGLIAILPLGLTIYVSWFLLNLLGNILGNLLEKFPNLRALPDVVVTALGLLLLLLLIYLVGVFTSNVLGRRFFKWAESLLTRIPFIRKVYSTSRQLTDTFLIDKAAFRQVVLVEWPRKGIYTLGFVTSELRWPMDNGDYALNIFIPNTPNPTGGRLYHIPEREIIPTSLSVEWALKMVISGGIVAPSPDLLEKIKTAPPVAFRKALGNAG
jgi:uncharacterized membrane protein